MSYSNLSIDQAPTISTPVRFFITAPLFGIAAMIGLFFHGPEILQQRWLPQTLAITHLFTLGFISMTMMGALFQLLPVLAGASVYKAAGTSKIVHGLVTGGIVLFTLGLYISQAFYIRLGLMLLIPGLLLFLVSVSISLLRARASHAAVTGMRLSVLSLWISVGLGLLLGLGHSIDAVPLLRQYTGIHVAWAAIGWVSLLIISIAYQVIPMFQVTQEYPTFIKRYFTPLVFLLLLLWSLLRILEVNREWLDTGMFTAICILFVLFISITLQLLMQRKKRMADASLYFWLIGLLMLAASLLLAFYAQITWAPLLLPAAVIFIVGFVLSIINGMLYKILPFLVWLHLHQQRAVPGTALRDIPSMNEIIPPRNATLQLYLHGTGVICLLLALYYPSIFFYPALLFLITNWLLLEIHLLRALQLYRRHLQAA